jgi:virginiamycin B lyase
MMRRRTKGTNTFWFIAILLVLSGFLFPKLVFGRTQQDSFPPGSYPSALFYGPNQSYWLTLISANQLAEVDGASLLSPPTTIITHTIPTLAAAPSDLTIGQDQNIWFTEQNANQIGWFDLAGNFEEYGIPTPDTYPAQITLGHDENLWFTELEGNAIGRLIPGTDGAPPVITEFALPNPGSTPLGITSALDGSLWFTERNGQRLGRITPEGVLTEYNTPDLIGLPTVITLGPDGNLWFIYEIGKKIVRVDPETYAMSTFTLPTTSPSLLDLAIGPDGRLWFLGVDTIGSVLITPSGPTDLTESPIEPSVFEGEGNSRLVAGAGPEMVYITSNSQEVYTATVPGGAQLKDLQIFLNEAPKLVLGAGEFTFHAEVRNWSNSPAAGTQVTLALDSGFNFVEIQTPVAGATCASAGGQVVCDLGALPGSSSTPITYTLTTFPFTFESEPVTRTLELRVSTTDGDYVPANNRTFRHLQAQKWIDYFNDFSLGSDEFWSHNDVQSVNGLEYLGAFEDQIVRLTFEDLPPHDRISACFDLYIMGAWDGSVIIEPGATDDPPVLIGPDLWSNYFDETRWLVTTFSNRADAPQAFPANYREGENPAQTLAAELGDFDNLPEIQDARYHLCRTFEHSKAAFVATFYGLNLDGSSGESWSLDNVSVQIYYAAVENDRIYLPILIQE